MLACAASAMPLKHHDGGVAKPRGWWGLLESCSSTNPWIMSSSCAGISCSAFLRHSGFSVPSYLSISTLSFQRA